MDIRQVTAALNEATEMLTNMTKAMTILLNNNAALEAENAQLKLDIQHWKDTYGTP